MSEEKMEPRRTIVIADDNVNICQTLEDILIEKGYDVKTVGNGYELLEYLKEQIPHVVILDIMMPAKGGLEVLNAIKSISSDIKIIIYTGFPQYEKSVYASFVNKLLIKTDSPEKLLDAVNELTQ